MAGTGTHPWWRGAVIYQVYPRSFADGNGDGIGDLAGIRARLDYLAELEVDAVWFSPWYPSPMADAGYDVADYRDIDPVFGTLAEAEALITEAHERGMRIIVDLVPNHCSDRHEWFQAALAAGPGSAERQRFWFRAGRGDSGELPPTELKSIFGGPAWTRVTEPDGSPGEWYLHLFAPEQPDFNWDCPEVCAEFEDILRFWLDRGVDGIRIDSAAVCVKNGDPERDADYTDQDGVHEIYRAWRRVAESYGGDRALIGEVWLEDTERFGNYLRADELHTAFNFDFLCCPWEPAALRERIDATLRVHRAVDAPATWVLSNHDVTRHVTRYGRQDSSFSFAGRREGVATDLELGTVRARAALLLALALPGSAYVYQGEELGLFEVEDIPYGLRQDPMWHRSGGRDPGRDGCRVPLPWSGAEPPFGFSPAGASGRPWLPQPKEWKDRTVAAQTGDPASMLELYRAALRIRREEPAFGDGTLRWLPAADGVLAFARDVPTGYPLATEGLATEGLAGDGLATDSPTGSALVCVVNLSHAAVPLPEHDTVVLASRACGDTLPPDTAVWLRVTTG